MDDLTPHQGRYVDFIKRMITQKITRLLALTTLLFSVTLLLTACDDTPWNRPYPKPQANHQAHHTLYSSFTQPPKTLDPARSFTVDEAVFTYQIYEPVVQYHYLKRPYVLEPLTAKAMPKVTLLDGRFRPLPKGSSPLKAAYTQYDMTLKPGILYQPHPAFAQDGDGHYRYHQLSAQALDKIRTLQDFPQTGTRELTAADYVYEIKRLAHPRLNSPIFSMMAAHIVGLQDYGKQLSAYDDRQRKKLGRDVYLDLRQFPLKGVKVIDRYHYRIVIKGSYPPFLYWLSTPFFAPIPWEADRFYAQSGMDQKNLSFDWSPVGTGAYLLSENNPNQRMVLSRNPNYHPDFYPTLGAPLDKEKGLLAQAGKKLPMINHLVFMLEKESMPRWHKFLQGYYDQSVLTSDSFDQAVKRDAQGQLHRAPALAQKDIRMETSVGHTLFYSGFNMKDKVVGGTSERARKLRRAITLAMNSEEFVHIFNNDQGLAAQGPLPPGVAGYLSGEKGINPFIYSWHNNHPQRKPIALARQLLAEAGYPHGCDAKTGKPLILHYDTSTNAGADSKARFDWLRKQLAKLNIQLQIRATQYGRYQQKLHAGNVQLFLVGWVADYPDPENFLQLFYGPHATVPHGGTNYTNYQNPTYDRLFEQVLKLPDSPKRLALVAKMVRILREDSPGAWLFYPMNITLHHRWLSPTKPDDVIRNNLKYMHLDPAHRNAYQAAWNKPIRWPLGLLVLLIIAVVLPAWVRYCWRMRKPS